MKHVLKKKYDGFCVVSANGKLVNDEHQQDYVFERRKDANATLLQEDLANGYRIARCTVVPRE